MDLGPPAQLWHRPGVAGVAQAQALAQGPDQFEHALPLGEDDDLDVAVLAALFEDLLQFVELGAGAVLRVEDVIGVADHAHHGELPEQLLLLLLGQRPALGDAREARHLSLVVRRSGLACSPLSGTKNGSVGAIGQFGFDVGFAPAQHEGADALVQLVEVPVARRAGPFRRVRRTRG